MKAPLISTPEIVRQALKDFHRGYAEQARRSAIMELQVELRELFEDSLLPVSTQAAFEAMTEKMADDAITAIQARRANSEPGRG